MRRTRILAVGIPRLLSDIVSHVLQSDDMEVVATLPGRADMLRIADEASADVVILGMDDGELPEECAALFDTHPRIKVLGVARGGRQVYLYELCPCRSALGEVSPTQLLQAIRKTLGQEVDPSAHPSVGNP